MGAYSSWSTFSICHHAIVRLAAVRAGLPASFSRYALLGDDIVIANDEVAFQYRIIISELGVSLSEAKTHVSKDTYEFAKRWILRGTEVTGAPFGSMFEAIRFVGKDAMKALGEDFIPTKAIKHISYYEVVTWFRELEGRWSPRPALLGSRGLFATLFTLLGRGPIADRLATKAWRFYLLPSREDTRLVRHWKAFMLLQSIGPGMVSCFSWQRAPISIGTLLNECKARVLEGAIKNQLGQLRRFQLESQRLVGLVPEGLDAQSILPSLAPLAVLRRNIAELQLEFDKAHRVRESDDISQWLHLDVRLFLDPFAVLSTRKSKTMATAKVTVLNHLSAMIRGIEYIRDVALTDLGLSALVRLINSHDVTPTRGDRRRTRKAPSHREEASSGG
jgi:hypothetical protein